jgi:C-terminal processing protease CtpA/Prc
VNSASGKVLPDDIAYVRVTTFGDNTTTIENALKTLMAQNQSMIWILSNGADSTAVE